MPESHPREPDHRREYAATLLGWLDRLSSKTGHLRISSTLELFEKAREVSVPASWRTPAHVCDFGILLSEVHGEYLKPDVDHPRRRREQISRSVAILFGHSTVLGSARPTLVRHRRRCG